jgi:ribosomal protein S18 acetylase RimI-like enzyme
VFTAEVIHGWDETVFADIVRIERDAFPPEWHYRHTEDYYRAKIEKADTIAVLLRERGKSVGFLIAVPHSDAGRELTGIDPSLREDPAKYYIEAVAILPACRGKKGFPAMLGSLQEALRRKGLNRVTLHARVSNNLSSNIQKNMEIVEVRRIDRWKYYNCLEAADYIEAIF